MTIPFYCLVVAMLLPYLAKVPLAMAQAKADGGYDNRHPRDQQAGLTGWGRRASAAHLNSFEVLPIFASAVFIAHLSGANAEWSARLSIAFIVTRVIYIALYVSDKSTLRSLFWGFGMLSCLAMALLSAF